LSAGGGKNIGGDGERRRAWAGSGRRSSTRRGSPPRQTQSPQLYQRAAELALQSRSGQRALIVANEWYKAFPQSRDANRYMLQIQCELM
jgi:hypothetical protein